MATESTSISGYNYYGDDADPSHDYLLPTVLRLLGPAAGDARLFDLGCGDGRIDSVRTRQRHLALHRAG